MSPPAVFSFDFHRFEPVYVFTIEEHEPHCTDSLVDLERMAREDGSLDNNPVRIVVEESPSSKQGEFTVILFLNIIMTFYSIKRVKSNLIDEDWGRREGDGREGCHHDCSVPEVSLVLVFVPVGVLAEDGTGGKPPPADLEDQPGLGLDGERAREGMSPHGNVYHGHSVLVRQETCDHQTRGEVAL